MTPALVLTTEYDLLRAEGDLFADRLAAAGVQVEHHVVPGGGDHYFLTTRDQARPVLDLVVAALRRVGVGS